MKKEHEKSCIFKKVEKKELKNNKTIKKIKINLDIVYTRRYNEIIKDAQEYKFSKGEIGQKAQL